MPKERLVCEGYLLKRRGAFQNRTRWFRLTTSEFQYFTTEEVESKGLALLCLVVVAMEKSFSLSCPKGDMIASFPLDKIVGVSEEGSTQFELIQGQPFGASQRTRMLLEAKTRAEKRKWLGYLKQLIGVNQEEYKADEELICESCLSKIRGAIRRQRWFRLTNKAISYYTENGGDLLASLELGRIDAVKSSDSDTFVVYGNYNFSASGKSDMTLKCPYSAVKKKWMKSFKRLQEEGLIKVKY